MGVPIGGGMMETTAYFDEVEGVVNELQFMLTCDDPLNRAERDAVRQMRELLMLAATALFETQMLHLGLLKRHGQVGSSDSSAV